MTKFIVLAALSGLLVTPLMSSADAPTKTQQIIVDGDQKRLRIDVAESDGKHIEIELDIDNSTAGEITSAVLERLRKKGIAIDDSDGENVHIEINSDDVEGNIEGLDVLQSLKLLKGLEILKELENLDSLEGDQHLSIEINVEKTEK
ncbi:MAG: hypothetical protein RL336_412 [Pseudomonadota bacterium]|jgi:hypothetical protein